MPDTEKKPFSCTRCGRTYTALASQYFFRSSGALFSGLGYFPVCKSCLNLLYDEFIEKYGSAKIALKRLCIMLDVYYNEQLASSVLAAAQEDKVFGNYLKKLNIWQFRSKTFENSLSEGFSFSEFIAEKSEEPNTDLSVQDGTDEDLVPDEIIAKWGSGLDYEDYQELENHYKYLKSANPRADGNQEIFIRDCCYTKAAQLKAYRENRMDDYMKLTESYTKSYKQGGLKAVGEQSISEDFTIGVTAETIEKYTPAEYYKDKKLYKDFDGIGEYFSRHVIRPLKNIMFGTSDKDDVFYVKDEEDDNEYDED